MLNNSAIIIIIVVAFAFYLVYSQNKDSKHIVSSYPTTTAIRQENYQSLPCSKCEKFELLSKAPKSEIGNSWMGGKQLSERMPVAQPTVTNVVIDNDNDPYSDAIKKQDMYSMLDPLTYPQLRLPREVLEKYNEYYEKNGVHPPFNQATQPLFDNPILVGVLIKQVDENEPFSDNIPSSVPLFRVKSAKNTNRYFYYILDQQYFSKVEPKIPLYSVKINGVRHNNAEITGLPEIMHDDIIEHIPIYPRAKFKVLIYTTYHFP